MLACGTSSTVLLRHRSITIQLRLAALYLMHHRLFQQTLFYLLTQINANVRNVP